MKKIYKMMINTLNKTVVALDKLKNHFSEKIEIFKKRKIIRSVQITKSEKINFIHYWKSNYGKIVSPSWHKLYTYFNGNFIVDYFPDILYTAKLEYQLNDRSLSKFYSDKNIANKLYQGVQGVSLPKTIIYNSHGVLYNAIGDIISVSEAIDILSLNNVFVIKKSIDSSSGKGVRIIQLTGEEDRVWFRNLLDGFGDNFLVQEKIKQHPVLSRIYSKSVNTLRVITYICNDKIKIAPVSLRMGCGGNVVDNIHSGGIVVGVDDNGYLRKNGYQLGYTVNKIIYEKHPDSKMSFIGLKIPNYSKVIEGAINLHKHTPGIRMVSWDLIVDEYDKVVLIEGNYIGQSVWFPQIVNEKGLFGTDTKDMIKYIKKGVTK